MSKVTSKLQITLPKAIADRYCIRPGDEVQFAAAGDVVRLVPSASRKPPDTATRLRRFDQATARQRQRQAGTAPPAAAERGWTREELYVRGGPR